MLNGDMRTLKSMGMSMGDGGGATGTKSGFNPDEFFDGSL